MSDLKLIGSSEGLEDGGKGFRFDLVVGLVMVWA